MKICLITGSAGLIGSESVKFFSEKGFKVIGIDNDMRSYFFGESASTKGKIDQLKAKIEDFENFDIDIRDWEKVKRLFESYGGAIELIIHTAAQPSHDWAAKEPFTDFTINANGTLNLLEACRQHCPEAVFIFTSTNKVYGDRPNTLPLEELEDRWEIKPEHPFFEKGINEQMSIDNSMHSLFGASKVAADVMVQEYGKYFGMKTATFRGGCLTGPNHSGAELHGFLAYLMKCAATKAAYRIFGYKGKQVRDNIHSYDLVNAFYHLYQKPAVGKAFNIGGGRYSNCSMKEAINLCEEITGNKMDITYLDENRKGDHIWWISDNSAFEAHCPDWKLTRDVPTILNDIFESNKKTWVG